MKNRKANLVTPATASSWEARLSSEHQPGRAGGVGTASLHADIKHSLADTFERDHFKHGQEGAGDAVPSQRAEEK